MKIFDAFNHSPLQICDYSIFITRMRGKKYSLKKMKVAWLLSDEYDSFINEFICEQIHREVPEAFKDANEFYVWMKSKRKLSEKRIQLKNKYKDIVEALI